MSSLPPLLTLPPELLSPIFLEAGISLDNFLISRPLLPYTLEALFHTVNLYSRAQIHSFSQAVQNTQHAAHVKRLAVSTIIDREAVDEEESDDSDSEGESVASSVGDEGSATDDSDSRADLAVQSLGPVLDDIALPLALAYILRRLSNLESLACIGCETMAVTWDNFYQEGVLPKLASVLLQLHFSDDDEFTNEDNNALFVAISRLPSLKTFEIQGPTGILPLDVSAFASATPTSRPIPVRSWTLTTLQLDKVYRLGIECSYLFEAFAELLVLVIEAVEAGADFTRAIGLLPTTLRTLTLIFHYEADPSDPTDRRDHLPQLDNLATQFPNLEHLHLTGQIYSPKLLESLHLSTSLYCLLLGHGAPLSTASLLQLVQPESPRKMPALKHLDPHVCFPRPVHQHQLGSRIAPVWTEEFPRRGAKKLARVCEEVGVELRGSVKCALRTCDCARGDCSRAC